MKLPILWNHDPQRPTGMIDGNIATFKPNTVTRDMIVGFGYRILETETTNGVTYVLKAEIFELSFYPLGDLERLQDQLKWTSIELGKLVGQRNALEYELDEIRKIVENSRLWNMGQALHEIQRMLDYHVDPVRPVTGGTDND